MTAMKAQSCEEMVVDCKCVSADTATVLDACPFAADPSIEQALDGGTN
jgi:hypothetical protein